jgi:hypothetical protein
MTKRYDAQDVHKVVAAVRRYYEGKRTRDCDCGKSGDGVSRPTDETAEEKTDLYNFDSKNAQDSGPPRTLAQMNQFLRDYYPRRRSTAAR